MNAKLLLIKLVSYVWISILIQLPACGGGAGGDYSNTDGDADQPSGDVVILPDNWSIDN